MRIALLLIGLLLITACADKDGKIRPTGDSIFCTDPRPDVCIELYEQVCGSDGKTYSNSCKACANAAVDYSTPGECGGNS
jgi:hypothetical protein